MGKGENGSFHLRRKAHENPKVFVGVLRSGATSNSSPKADAGPRNKKTDHRGLFL